MPVAVTATAECDECTRKADVALCRGCHERRLDEAADNAWSDEPEERSVSADEIRDWLAREKYKPTSPLSAETIAAFERCIEDLEAQHG